MSTKLFSIIIPTRQRHDTLRYSIQSVLNQTHKDFELIIMDNFSSKETSEVVFSFDDPRIKYYRSPERLSMTANWELALSHSTGEYVTIIGDDDGLLPDALERCLILLNQNKVNIVTWFRWPYFWPDASSHHQRNQLFIPLEQGIGIWDSKESLKLCYQYKITYERLPMLYNSFVNREIIQKVKSVYGTYYPPKTISPDICSGILNAYFTESYLFSTRFLSIAGISGHSIGMSQVTLSKDSKSSTPADLFIKEHNDKYLDGIIHKKLIPSLHQKIGIASDMLTVKDAFFLNDNEIQFNVRGLLGVLASEINSDPDNYENTLTDIKNLAQKYGISLSELNVPSRAFIKKGTKIYHGPIRDNNGNVSGLIVDCKLAGITDVAQAALLAYGIMEGESEAQENYGDFYATLQQGEKLFSEGQTVEAMRCFTKILKESDSSSICCQAFNNLGVIAHSLNEMERAEQWFLKAIEIDSINIDALLNLSDVYLIQGFDDKAQDVLKRAFVAHPASDQIAERLALLTPALDSKITVETSEPPTKSDSPDALSRSIPEEKSDPIVFDPESLKPEIRKLNIGGHQRADGWEIFNAVDAPEVDHLGNAADLSKFADETFESLYSSNVLEHIDYLQLEKLLREWKRVLIPGGKIYVSVPNFDKIATLLIKRKKSDLKSQFHLMRMIFGEHIDKSDYNCIGLNQTILTHFLHSAGFINIQKVDNFQFITGSNQMKFEGMAITLNMSAKKPKDQ